MDGGPQPASLNPDGAFNIAGWATIASESWSQNGSPPWRRGDARLVRDYPDTRLRLTIGDLAYRTTGFQTFAALGGVALSKELTLQPYRISQPAGEAEFFLDATASVSFFVNDHLLRSQRLPAGPYRASSFPFLSGANDVRLEIADDLGARRTLEFPFFYDSALLVRGETEFTYAIGVPSVPTELDRRYETARPVVSMFHRVGLTDALTVEANGQAKAEQQVIGAGVVTSGRLGTIRGELAVSHADAAGYGNAISFQYDLQDSRPTNGRGQAWGASGRYFSPNFASLGTSDPVNPVAIDLAARYSMRLGGDLGIGFGIDFQAGREGRRDTNGQTVSMQRGLAPGLTASLRLRRQQQATGERELSAMFVLSLRSFLPGQSVSASRDTARAESRLDWRLVPSHAVGDFGAFVSVGRSPKATDATADLAHVGTRGTVGATYSDYAPRGAGNGGRTRDGSIRGATAIVYADGAFAVSRPVTGAFAIFSPHPALAGQTIGLNAVGDGHYQARIDSLGPAVLPELTRYRVERATLDARGLPIGLELGPGFVDLAPTYKSGIRVVVGTGAKVFLVATVQTAFGEPISLQAAQVESVGDPQSVPKLTFTNRTGRLALDGLAPGKYLLRLFATPDAPIAFEIPADTVGQYNAGVLHLGGAADRPDAPAIP